MIYTFLFGYFCLSKDSSGGGGEIRTLDPLARIVVFKTTALGHYATPPKHKIQPTKSTTDTYFLLIILGELILVEIFVNEFVVIKYFVRFKPQSNLGFSLFHRS